MTKPVITSPKTQQIAKNFASAYHSYHQNAKVQALIVDELLCALCQACPQLNPKVALEIGCGTGLLTQKFCQTYQVDTLYLNDLYDKIKQNAVDLPFDVRFLIGDIEMLDLANILTKSPDLVLSSSCVQWLEDLPKLCVRLYNVMADDGVLAVSSFLPDNLKEIKTLTGQGLTYLSVNELYKILKKSGFTILTLFEKTYTLYFDSPKAVLRHIKQTGVALPNAKPNAQHKSERFVWTKETLSAFCQAYHDRYALQDIQNNAWRYPLTYQAVFVIGQKSKR